MPANEQLLELKLRDLERGSNVRPIQDADVRELAEDVKEHGVLQPILVAKKGDRYEVIAGHRRCRAAELAKLVTVPARVVLDSKAGYALVDHWEIQLVENLHREDLTPLQEAKLLQQLTVNGQVAQSEVAKKIGKSQPYVANRIRLLKLPEGVQRALESGKISPSQGELLLQLPAGSTPRDYGGLVDYQSYAQPNGRQFEQEVRQRVGVIKRRLEKKQARAEAIEKAKFRDCPSPGCGKTGSPDVDYAGKVQGFRCRNGHHWSPATGKLERARNDSYAAVTADRAAPRAPPPPTLAMVDRKVAEHPEPGAIAARVLECAGEILGFSIESSEGRGRGQVYLQIWAKEGDLKDEKFPPFGVGVTDDETDASVRISEEWRWGRLQENDAGRKKAAELRQQLVDWLGTIRGRGRPKKEGK